MTGQQKTFIAREFDKLENRLDSKYALYENGYQSALFDTLEVVNKLPIHNVSDTLIAWEQFKKANWYESEAIDVEKMLMDKFQAIYGR